MYQIALSKYCWKRYDTVFNNILTVLFCHSTKCLILYHFVLCTWCCFTNHFRRLYIYIYILKSQMNKHCLWRSATAVKTLVQECCEKSVLFFFLLIYIYIYKQNLWKFIRSFRPFIPTLFIGTLLCFST